MNVKIINIFVDATITAFKIMLQTDVTIKEPYKRKEKVHSHHVSGEIALKGNATGIVSLSLPKKVANDIVSQLIEDSVKDDSPELLDGVGEIAQIIVGNAKNFLKDYKLELSLPSMVVGKNRPMDVDQLTPLIIIPMQCPIGEFALEVAFKDN